MSELEIGVEWTTAEHNLALARNTAAELTIKVGNKVPTFSVDVWSRTTTERTRVSLYPMAVWLASNWWRLNFECAPETGTQPSPEWRLAHDLPSAGGGYVWPSIRFASDGDALQVSAQSTRPSEWEPVHYLTAVEATRISRANFEKQVDDFISLVMDRLRQFGHDPDTLCQVWSDVLEERKDPEVAAWRRLEAMLGFDAGEVRDDLISHVSETLAGIGHAARDEIACALGATDTRNRLDNVVHVAERSGIRAKIEPIVKQSRHAFAGGATPWKHGGHLARMARRQISREDGALTTAEIRAVLNISGEDWNRPPSSLSFMSLGIRRGDGVELFLRRGNEAARRFEAARFVADQVLAPVDDRWLPQTDRRTLRQQTQRAFAAEFLVPFDDLAAEFGPAFDDDTIEDAASHYGVSPLVVRHQLANHDVLQQR